MRKKIILLTTVAVFFLVLLLITRIHKSEFNIDDVADRQVISMMLSGQRLNIEVVNTQASIVQGLSGRDAIGSDGMLFILPAGYSNPRFWMKQMKFNLDIIWLKDFAVVDVSKNVPAPDQEIPLEQLPTYSPKVDANMVLEVDAGNFDSWNIKIGDKLTIIE